MERRTLYLVFSNPVEGKEPEFNEWYDNVHLPEVLATPGVVSAQRFDTCDTEIVRTAGWTPEHRYLAVYEMDGDPDVIMGKIGDAVAAGEMVMSETLDLQTVRMSFWTPRGPKLQAEPNGAL
jgi:hypothetical protein